MHQYSACTDWVTTLASAGTPLSASQLQASQSMKSNLNTPEHPPLPEGNETPRWRLPALELLGDTALPSHTTDQIGASGQLCQDSE
jgi:hypothetical protein